METNGTQPDRVRAPRRWISAAGLVGAGLLAGGILAGSQLAGAATRTSGSATVAAASTAASSAEPDPATVAHGPGETLLTGAAAAKATAAAKAAVPGGTIIRVETDSEGAAYEAHIQKADGSFVTVKVDRNFNVTDTVGGFGHGAPPSGSSGNGASGNGA